MPPASGPASSPVAGFSPSANIAQLRESATIAVSQRAKALRAAGRAILDLGAGEPDFDTPELIRASATAAMNAGATRYTPTEGTLALRAAVAKQATALRGRGETIGANEVVVSNGSKQSIFNACFALFGAGDEVLIPTPAWTSYYEIVALARATPVSVLGDEHRGFRVDPEMLAAHATSRTRGLLLNSPVNPTGTVYTQDELRAMLDLAERHGWWVISDEIYRRIAYEHPASSALEVAGSRARLIVADGVAKAYAMTGWRIGWTVAAPDVTRAMAALQSHTTFGASSVSQAAAVAALEKAAAVDPLVDAMVREFRVRRDAAVALFRSEPALQFVPAEGAFYVYFKAPGAGRIADAGTAFAATLLEQHDVAVVPGVAFNTSDWVRMSYATDLKTVETAVGRIVAAWRAEHSMAHANT